MRLNGVLLSESERLKLLNDMEHEECEALSRMVPEDAISTLERVLDTGTTAQVLRLTHHEWKEKSAHQRRAMIAWTERRIEAMSEKLTFMKRNVGVEPELPQALRVAGGGL